MKRYLRTGMLAATCGLAIVVAACGSSDSSSSGTGPATAGNEAVVNVGVVGTFSGIPGVAEAAPKIMDAWEKTVNDAGGINGHKVNVILKDVGTRTGAGRAAVQELIQKDHVAAILSQDPNESTWVKYAEQQAVPVISAQIAVSPYMSTDVFPIIESPITLAYATDYAFKQAGGVGAIAIPSEIAAGEQVAQTIKQLAPSVGVELPVITKMSSSTTDFTPFCQQMKQADVTAYLAVFGEDISHRIMTQCAEQKAGGTRVLQGFTAAPSWKTDPLYDESVVIDAIAPFFDESIPGVQTYRDALSKYAPEVRDSRFDNTQHAELWAGAQMVAAAMAKVQGHIDGTSLQRALYTMKDETLDGLIAPATYTKGQTPTIRCFFTWKVSGGQFVADDGGKPVCAPKSILAPAEASLAKALAG
jgi:branched-chain amino acid transport system substrate-binding protein